MEPFSLYNPRPLPSHILSVSFSFSVSPILPPRRLLSVAVYKSGRRLYPPTTMYRMEQGTGGREGESGTGAVSRGVRREGLGATRSVPLHPAQRCNFYALWERSVTGITAVSHPGHVLPPFFNFAFATVYPEFRRSVVFLFLPRWWLFGFSYCASVCIWCKIDWILSSIEYMDSVHGWWESAYLGNYTPGFVYSNAELWDCYSMCDVVCRSVEGSLYWNFL